MSTVDFAGATRTADLEEILGRVADVVGSKKDGDIADALGVGRSTIPTWRTRGKVPYETLYEFAAANNLSFHWLIEGTGVRRRDIIGASPAVGARIVRVRSNSRLGIEAFADEVQTNVGHLRDMEDGACVPDIDLLVRLKSRFLVNAEWLLSGVGPIYQPGCAPEGHEDEAGVPPMYLSAMNDYAGGDRPVAVPRYGIQLAAGGGASVIEEATIGHLWFLASYLEEFKIRPGMAGIASVRGNSMEGLLFHGDSVLFNRGINRIISGSAYALRVGDELLVKYLSHQNGRIVVSSENSALYPPYDLPESDFEDGHAEVIGLICSHNHNWLTGLVDMGLMEDEDGAPI